MARTFIDHWRILDEDHVITFNKKRAVYHSKPIHLGVIILEISKWKLFEFFYDKVRPHFPAADVVNTDTGD